MPAIKPFLAVVNFAARLSVAPPRPPPPPPRPACGSVSFCEAAAALRADGAAGADGPRPPGRRRGVLRRGRPPPPRTAGPTAFACCRRRRRRRLHAQVPARCLQTRVGALREDRTGNLANLAA